MIRANTPGYKDIYCICQNSDESDEAVILIVKSSWARDIALAQFQEDGYQPRDYKLASIRNWMVDGAELDLSIMHVTSDGEAWFDEGRTRAIVAHEKGFKDYPIATTRRHAQRLKDHWGSVSGAKKKFDFTCCWEHDDSALILGNL